MIKYHKRFSLCRNCEHEFGCHCIYSDLKQGNLVLAMILPLEFVPCNDYGMNGKSCNCNEWVPKDNLEWLELKAEETKHE
jgi:hypothetical protein